MLCLADTILWSRDMDNYKITVVQTLFLWDVNILQSIENIMDGKDYQRGSIEKKGNRQRSSETIQDEEITISRTSHKTKLITTTTNRRKYIEGRRSRGRPRTTWITDLTNSTGAKYYQPKRAAEDRKRWHGLVVNHVPREFLQLSGDRIVDCADCATELRNARSLMSSHVTQLSE